MSEFAREVDERIIANGRSKNLQQAAEIFLKESIASKYSYNFSWLGRPIIQYPQDIIALQEIIWRTKPDLIVETGIAHGGSLIFSASMLELCALMGGEPDAKVLGIDVDIRRHNRSAIEEHPLFRRIELVEASSVDDSTIKTVRDRTSRANKVLICLDSNHTHDHVLRELEAYAPLTSVDSYCIVFDTIIEQLSTELIGDRPWKAGNSPGSAVREFLQVHSDFIVDQTFDNKLMLTAARGGYLRRVR